MNKELVKLGIGNILVMCGIYGITQTLFHGQILLSLLIMMISSLPALFTTMECVKFWEKGIHGDNLIVYVLSLIGEFITLWVMKVRWVHSDYILVIALIVLLVALIKTTIVSYKVIQKEQCCLVEKQY